MTAITAGLVRRSFLMLLQDGYDKRAALYIVGQLLSRKVESQ